METCEYINFDYKCVGETNKIKSVLRSQQYIINEYEQANSKDICLYCYGTIDDMALLILAMPN